MGSIKVAVTTASQVTNDSLKEYNVYSNIDGKLSGVVPSSGAETQFNGLADVVHQITAKPVGVSNGEFASVISTQVPVDLSTSTPVLASPTNFTATADSASQITLNWTKSANATNYVLTCSGGIATANLGDVSTK